MAQHITPLADLAGRMRRCRRRCRLVQQAPDPIFAAIEAHKAAGAAYVAPLICVRGGYGRLCPNLASPARYETMATRPIEKLAASP